MRLHTTRTDRLKGALAALLLQFIFGYVLFLGLAGGQPVPTAEDSLIYIVPPPPPRPAPEPPARRAPRPQGAAAPPDKVAHATPIVALPPIVPIIEIPPVIASPVAGTMADSDAGAAPTQGPGSGAGGEGTGTGQGTDGDGDGGGGIHARWIKGRISSADYPRAAVEAGLGGRLVARYTVGANGRVVQCDIVESSGSAILDNTTCTLVVKRFRYRPARDAAGKPVTDSIYEDHNWVFERRSDPED